MPDFFVYILRCRNGEFYTGLTKNLQRRVRQHNEGVASKFTRSRGPVELVYMEKFTDRGAALRREAQIKKLNRSVKLAMSKAGKEIKEVQGPR